MKLSPGQEDLIAAMKNGVKVHFVGGRNAHWFRGDTFRNCSATVRALEKRGLVKVEATGYGLHGHVVLTGKDLP